MELHPRLSAAVFSDLFRIAVFVYFAQGQAWGVHKGAVDRPAGRQQESGLELGRAGISPYHRVGAVVERPKALGDIRGVSYIYGIFYQYGLIDVPEKVKEKMRIQGNSEEI